MIRIKDRKQQQLFDPWSFLSPKRRKRLDQGWPGLFKEHLLHELPVKQVLPFFHQTFGRPTKDLYTVLGVLLLQQTMDLNDYETVDQLAFNTQWHYAMDIHEESDDAKYISEKTLWTMRQHVAENDIAQTIFENLTDKLADIFDVDTDKQRIDSVHIHSNMRRLGRIGIFSRTIHKFLVNLRRNHTAAFDTIDSSLVESYLNAKAMSAFSMVKPSESGKTLKAVSNNLFDLIQMFKDQPEICSIYSYKLMQRVLDEQCNVESDTGGKKVVVKAPKQIASDSLQNPSDPDATYDGHKGQGYQVQVMETFCDDENKKDESLNLITHVDVQPACESDANALVPAIADTQIRRVGPNEVLADTLYGSDKNYQTARGADVELIAPTQKGNESKPLSEFIFNDKGYVTACPAGHSPDRVKHKKKTDRYSASFDPDLCRGCPHFEHCPIKPGKKKNYLRYGGKQYRLSVRRTAECTEAFIDRYRWRAGVEATMSEYDRLTGVKKLRVRGMKAVRFCAKMKAAGLNMLRASRVRRARAKAQNADRGLNWLSYQPFTVIKERIHNVVVDIIPVLRHRFGSATRTFEMAA